MDILESLSPDALSILLVLFLSFLIGLGREEHKAAGSLPLLF